MAENNAESEQAEAQKAKSPSVHQKETQRYEAYKLRNQIALLRRQKMDLEKRYSHAVISCEEWKSKCKNAELDLTHANQQFDAKCVELQCKYRRETETTHFASAATIDELSTKLLSAQSRVDHLVQINEEQQKQLAKARDTCETNKNYIHDLELQYAALQKESLATQRVLSDKLGKVDDNDQKNFAKLGRDLHRSQQLCELKTRECDRLLKQLTSERQDNAERNNMTQTKHREHIQSLESTVDNLTTQVETLERQLHEMQLDVTHAKDTVQQMTDRYISDCASKDETHARETERRDNLINDLKKSLKDTRGRLARMSHLMTTTEIDSVKAEQRINMANFALEMARSDALHFANQNKELLRAKVQEIYADGGSKKDEAPNEEVESEKSMSPFQNKYRAMKAQLESLHDLSQLTTSM